MWDSHSSTSIEYGEIIGFHDINDAGQVVGFLSYLSQVRAALWNCSEDIEYIGTPIKNGMPIESYMSSANRINNASKVVGAAGSCVKWPCGFHCLPVG